MKVSKKNAGGIFNKIYTNVINRIKNADDDILTDIENYYSKKTEDLYKFTLKSRKNLRYKIINRISYIIQNINFFKKKNKLIEVTEYKNRLSKIVNLLNKKIYLYFNKNFHEHINFNDGKEAIIIQNSDEFNEIMLEFILTKLKKIYNESDIKFAFLTISNKSNINDIIKIINDKLSHIPTMPSNSDNITDFSHNSLDQSIFKSSLQSNLFSQSNKTPPPFQGPVSGSPQFNKTPPPFQGPVSGSPQSYKTPDIQSPPQPFTPTQSTPLPSPLQKSKSKSLKSIIEDNSITILSDPNKNKTEKIKLEILRNNDKPYGNREYINILEYLKNTKNIHTISLHSITNDAKYYYVTFANKPDGNLKKFMQENNNVTFHFNALQQLLFACMLFHKLTGKLHTNLNSENIYYYKIENNLNTDNYFGYYFNALNKTFYIRNIGYLWVLSDFNETQTLPQDETILFNDEYKKFNTDYEPYHMYFEYRAILEIYKEYLNTIYDSKFEILRNYIDLLLDNTKNINEKFKRLLLDQKLTSQQKLIILDRLIFTKYMQNDYLLLKNIRNKTKQSKVYLQEFIENNN
jgi:hypothetical protein